jgi:uncharacterized protein (DUF885 family)
MNRRIIPLAVFALIASSTTSLAQDTASADRAYRALADEYLAGHLAWRPQDAVGLGLHEFDGKVTDLSRASLDREHARLRDFRTRIAAIDGKTLSRRADIQRRLLLTAIDSELFNFEVMKSHSHNPMNYAGAIDVNIYAKRDFAPKPQRLRSVIAILRHMPAVMQAARDNLDPVLPKPYVETTMLNAEGGAKFLESDLVEAFQDVTDPPLQTEFLAVNKAAVGELRRYVEYLKTEKLPKADNGFAIGRDAFARMLTQRELLSQTPDQILEIGLRELRKEQEIFTKTAARIDPGKPAVEVYQDVQRDHPTAASLLPDTRKHLEKIRAFLVAKDIVTFPSDVRVTVDETPQFARATSFASMDSPGPFETKATQAYYYVTPVEPDWDAKKQEEWLTAFNFYTTDVVSIHEAYPGHYVQFLHVQASDADRLDKVFGSYAFIEGWAHYCEQMVIDEGFGEDDGRSATAVLRLVADKYRLAQSAEALLRLCRLCVAIKMHTQGMTLEEGTKFFMDNCYYAEAPARSEANRGTFDPSYCFYTIGKLQLLKLRDEYRQQEGANYSLKRFHDEVLRHGAPPVRLLRETVLKDSSLWNASL